MYQSKHAQCALSEKKEKIKKNFPASGCFSGCWPNCRWAMLAERHTALHDCDLGCN